MLTFDSLLIAKEMFKEVKFGFLTIGHIDEDIDRCIGYLLK
jgi:hypothetical protein